MNFALALERTAGRTPTAPALAQGDRALDYAELAERTSRLGVALRDRGLEPGDRVAIVQANRPELLETMLACWHQGLICVPLNARCTPYEAASILGDCAPVAAVFDAEYTEHVDGLGGGLTRICTDAAADRAEAYEDVVAGAAPRAAVSLAPDAPAWLFYSSGTTGRMKGATLTHRNLLFMCLSFLADLYPLTAADVVLHAAPLTHGSGLYALPPILRGAPQLLTAERSFTPSACLDLIAERGVTNIAFLAPTMVNRLAEEQRTRAVDTSSLRCCVYGGAPMYVEDIKAAVATFGPVFAQIYGQAECPVTISRLGPADHDRLTEAGDDDRLGSAGIVYPGVDVRIDDGSTDGDGLGEVLVRGDVVMSGYWANEEATARTVTDGWLHTGDVGRIDADGFLYLVDRSKDVIISGAANIYPREVEEVVLRHPAVREVCVVGAPDPEWGERVVAVVGLEPGGTGGDDVADEIEQLCRKLLSGYKVPRQVEFVDDLPKSAYGKILKRVVRDGYWKDRDRQI